MPSLELDEQRLGAAIKILYKSSRNSFNIASAYLWVAPAIRHDQIIIQRGYRGTPLAYATWAFLSEDLSKSIATNDPPFLHLSEWNEGACLWIIDFVAPYGQPYVLKNMLRNRLSLHHRSYKRLVRAVNGDIVRVKEIKIRLPNANAFDAPNSKSTAM